MPELPEVETVRRDLAPLVGGRRVTRLETLLARMVRRGQTPREVEAGAAGRRIEGLERHGKFLALHLDTGERLVFHLGMTGRLLYVAPGDTPALDRHTHVVVHLEDGARLLLRDIRQFGEVFLLPPGDLAAQLGLGPDLWLSPPTGEVLATTLRSTAKIKVLLLNQRKLAGLGNIYADESLYEAGIHPARRAAGLSRVEIGRLRRAVKHVLEEALRRRGSTVSDYVDAFGEPGSMQHAHRVYRREGSRCPRCGGTVRRMKLAGRGAYFCPGCQR